VQPRAYIRICAPRIQPRMNVLPDYGNYEERPEDQVGESEARRFENLKVIKIRENDARR